MNPTDCRQCLKPADFVVSSRKKKFLLCEHCWEKGRKNLINHGYSVTPATIKYAKE